MPSLFRKKDINELVSQSSPLKRTLKTWDLTFLGIGAIIGTGIFVLTGKGALTAGPALSVSFLIAAICCGFAGLCYAEFSSIAPVAGSAYTYSYIAFGEIIAFIIGWDLILEYALGAATVSVGWSGYFVNLLDNLGVHIPTVLTAAYGTTPGTTTYFNMPAFIIVIIITWIISMGITQTKRVNDTMVIVKLAVIILFIVCTIWFIKPENWHPFSPFGLYSHHNGINTGIIPAASIVFFSFIGFDSVSSSAEETVNPSKTLPRGILLSLLISTILYIVMTLIMTGVVKYTTFAKYLNAPILAVLANTGQTWLSIIVSIGAILGMTTVILVQLYGQSRISYSMSRDGLFPEFFGHVDQKHQTPFKGTWFFGVITALAGGLINLNILSELVNIGTLTAFILVSAGVLWMRHSHPELHRGFKAPGVPFTPIIAIIFCITLIAGLNWETWLRFVIWLILGLTIYFSYGRSHATINK
ncbi:putative amino acid permease YhdG [Lactiplantibacillus plantarum]|uniref:amino acid permease n=1 Tax=Lactiplantibacillus plantarum TaxID=1590 RepID=UPI000CFA6FB8|nr:amino acid permease [Lactiplantibacillus plantarum]SPE09204.1 putative amino acid permease YhdG [Lactiplantibacillus plantarum]SPE13711.1 putative amino acid permease YhdG [Lactiplantibacillus plantarum]SPH08759.1 putative amino acid permease YhdG [Lactiplantibacillus plantarum]SPH10972.1 putative amino acid permease YhdG [Lactiplantibacillus plantarum]